MLTKTNRFDYLVFHFPSQCVLFTQTRGGGPFEAWGRREGEAEAGGRGAAAAGATETETTGARVSL